MTHKEILKKVEWKDLRKLSTKEMLIENNLTILWFIIFIFYHLGHHLFPAVPTIKLAELVKRIDEALPEIEKKNTF